MLDEIINFSKELEQAGIYENLSNEKDKFVVLLIKYDCENSGNEEINLESEIIEQNQDNENYNKYLKYYFRYGLPLGKDNNKNLGGSQGLYSANFFTFQYRWTKSEKQKQERKTFKEVLIEKWEKSYNESSINLIEGEELNQLRNCVEVLKDNKDNFINMIIDKYVEHINPNNNLNKDDYDNFIEKNKKPIIVFFIPNNFQNNYEEKLKIVFEEVYLKNKIFNAKTEKGESNCPICGEKSLLSFPVNFNNEAEGKYFIFHNDRKKKYNIFICAKCAFHLNNFYINILSKIKIFPLFIDKKENDRTIELFKKEGDNLEKLSFRKIMENIYKKTSSDVLDFYLVIYNGNANLINIDYITGYRIYFNGESIFNIEDILNRTFFDYKLKNNYFSDKIDTKNKELDLLIYKYREKIFNFVYRANYNALNLCEINDIFVNKLRIDLRKLHDKEEKDKVNFNSLFENFYELNKIFGGNFMGSVEEVKSKDSIESIEDLSFYLGQAVYYLLSKSRTENKTHALVEPFINITSFKILAKKFEDLFNAYKHALPFAWQNQNSWFSKIWEKLIEHKENPFTDELKMYFYAGYFDPENVFFKSENRNNEEVNNG